MNQPTQPFPSDSALAARKARARLDATLKALTDQRDAALNVVVNLQSDKAELSINVEVAEALLKVEIERSNALRQSNSELQIVISNLQAQLAELTTPLKLESGAIGPVGIPGPLGPVCTGARGPAGPASENVETNGEKGPVSATEAAEFKVVETSKEPGLIERVKNAATNLVSGDKN